MNDIAKAMTITKAIAILKNGVNAKTWEEQTEAKVLGISALEKQVPKKPISIGKLHTMLRCPNCKCEVEDLIMQMGYCEHCGQAIDWS